MKNFIGLAVAVLLFAAPAAQAEGMYVGGLVGYGSFSGEGGFSESGLTFGAEAGKVSFGYDVAGTDVTLNLLLAQLNYKLDQVAKGLFVGGKRQPGC